MTGGLSVAVIGDHALVRDGIVKACSLFPGVTVVYSGDSLGALLELTVPPQVVLLDLDLHDRTVSASEASELVRRGMVVLAVCALGSAGAIIRAGASSFVSNRDTAVSLREVIDYVVAGESWTSQEFLAIVARDSERPHLSDQEERALVLYASGLKLQSVARQLGVKPTTAKEYFERVRAKYAAVGRPAPTKLHLRAVAVEDGLIGEQDLSGPPECLF